MQFTQDQIAAIIGTKEIELIALRMQLAEISQERDALKSKYEPVAIPAQPVIG